MTIKTFRGLIADGGQDTIVLHTNDGGTGYRIKKFALFPQNPGGLGGNYEALVQIFKTKQSSVPTSSGTTDFSDQTLLGAAFYQESDVYYQLSSFDVVFDNEVFNQDIYVTHTANEGSTSINYYIELEQVKLDLNENTVATLKDIRNTARTSVGPP